MMEDVKTIQSEIEKACMATLPRTKARNQALASIKWVLASEKGFAALAGIKCIIVPDISDAQVFDGRDNETMKARFYSAILKMPFVPVLLP
jgi:hypothetical protein